jgi:signal transduction histidine kinase
MRLIDLKLLPDLSQEEEGEIVRWFINLRWLAFVSSTALIFFSTIFKLVQTFNSSVLFALCALVGISNILFSKLQMKLKPSYLLVVQMYSDLIILSLMLYFSGWYKNPFFPVYLFHIFIASVIFPRKISLLVVFSVLLIFSLITFLISFDVIPLFDIKLSGHFVGLGWLFAFSIVILISWYFAFRLSELLKEKIRREKELRLELIQSSKVATAGEIASQFFHDVSTPMTVLLSQVERLKTQVPSEMQKDFEVLENQAKKVFYSLSKLLSFVRKRKRTDTEVKEELADIYRAVNEVLYLVRGKLEKLKINLNCEILTQSKFIPVSQNDLEHIILNLVLNSIDAVRKAEEKFISIRVYDKYDSVVIEVGDTGEGIPDDIKDKIFEPFFTTKDEGTGIGLSSVKRIVESYNGKIEFSSQRGKGTTFYIYLPYEKNSHSR